MARYYVPTILTDLHLQAGKKYTTFYPGLVTGVQFITPRPEYNIQQSQVNTSNQSRWGARMKQLYDWGHLDVNSPLEAHFILLNQGPPFGFWGQTVYSTSPASTLLARRAHRLSHLKRPLDEVPGDGDSSLPEPDGQHVHGDTYNPGFQIPEEGVYPYQAFIRPPAPQRLAAQRVGSAPSAASIAPWMAQSQQDHQWDAMRVEGFNSGKFIRNLYPYGNFCGPKTGTPHGGWFLYGLFGVADSDPHQSYYLYWITPVIYKVHSGYVLMDRGGPPWAAGWQDRQDYKDLTSPNPWHNDDNWIQLTSDETIPAGEYVLAGGNTTDPAPPGAYWFRLATGSASAGDQPAIWDTYEWRGEYRLDLTTPGIGFLKRREFAEVYPMMNLMKEREVVKVNTVGLLREKENREKPGGYEEEEPIPSLTREEKTRLRKRNVAEYGI